MNRGEYINWLRAKTKQGAMAIINLMERTKISPGLNVIRYQLIKSATSTAANYRAACRARSKKEFYAKICIVVEEADETQSWLEMIRDSDLDVDVHEINVLYDEWTEIVKIVTSAKHKSSP